MPASLASRGFISSPLGPELLEVGTKVRDILVVLDADECHAGARHLLHRRADIIERLLSPGDARRFVGRGVIEVDSLFALCLQCRRCGAISAPGPSFVNTSFLKLLEDWTLDELKRRIRVVNSTRQINDMIKSRLERASMAHA
jgi:hypothetical protein